MRKRNAEVKIIHCRNSSFFRSCKRKHHFKIFLYKDAKK